MGQTINKSQGQTLGRVGVYLFDACFGHGQLYVAAPRTCASPCRPAYDDACEETAATAAPPARTGRGGGSGMLVDACARCAGCAMVDPHTLLCVPCEADVDATEGVELTRAAVVAALAWLLGDAPTCTTDALLEQLADDASTLEVSVEFSIDELEPFLEDMCTAAAWCG